MPEDLKRWLPITRKELEIRGWDEVDVIIVSGDAYVDHPSFGHAVIGRTIEQAGYRVALLPQPNWRDDLRDFKKLGRPRLFFGITSGVMDSMVNHYTALKRLRSTDAYTPGNTAGFRPDRATQVYANILRELYPDSLIVIGGIEASMRRFTHYDYWSDSLMPSILTSSRADLLIYGMGEKPILALLEMLSRTPHPMEKEWELLPQTAYLTDKKPQGEQILELPSHEECLRSKRRFAEAFHQIETASNQTDPPTLVQAAGGRYVVVNPPAPLMSEAELDAVHELPYTRLPHPHYGKRGEIPAFNMINCSINIHRGCFGGCSFCTISAHQGKRIVSRSEASILKEAGLITRMPYFKGHLTDLGGPSANMYRAHGKNPNACQKCSRASCIWPEICPNLHFDHRPMTELYRKVTALPGVRKVTIGSGVRTDMIERATPKQQQEFHLNEYAEQLITSHVSGRLKVAPEHTEEHVLRLMRKPPYPVFLQFRKRFEETNLRHRLRQQLIPYFISSHPGCRLADMRRLSAKLREISFHPEQVQDFTPTPMTRSSVMYWTGLVPETGEPVFCETNLSKKRIQNQCFFEKQPFLSRKKQNR